MVLARIAPICAALVISACASEPPRRVSWLDADGSKSPAVLDRDHYECKRDAFTALPVANGTYTPNYSQTTCTGGQGSATCQTTGMPSVSTGDTNFVERNQLFDECMKSRGWTPSYTQAPKS